MLHLCFLESLFIFQQKLQRQDRKENEIDKGENGDAEIDIALFRKISVSHLIDGGDAHEKVRLEKSSNHRIVHKLVHNHLTGISATFAAVRDHKFLTDADDYQDDNPDHQGKDKQEYIHHVGASFEPSIDA